MRSNDDDDDDDQEKKSVMGKNLKQVFDGFYQ